EPALLVPQARPVHLGREAGRAVDRKPEDLAALAGVGDEPLDEAVAIEVRGDADGVRPAARIDGGNVSATADADTRRAPAQREWQLVAVADDWIRLAVDGQLAEATILEGRRGDRRPCTIRRAGVLLDRLEPAGGAAGVVVVGQHDAANRPQRRARFV